jgi:ATP-dependent protease ClpP protease subunit
MAKVNKETLDRWFDYNVDVESRTIYMGSEEGVDALMAEQMIKGMHILESKSTDIITIIMNNIGGDFFHGMAIYDVIQTSKCHCVIKVYGHAMSMGSLILQAADKRIMSPNSRFMMHFGYDSHSGHAKMVERWADESKRLSHLMENIYLDVMLEKEEKMGEGHLAQTLGKIMTQQRAFEHPPLLKPFTYTFSKKVETKREQVRVLLKEMLNFDTILTAEETVALGFADEIYTNK